jgi:two-component system phosphate regulon sensor histidine kinase PhoR
LLRSPFFRRLFVPNLLLICAAIGVVGLLGARRLRASYLERTRQAMRNDSWLVAQLIGDKLQAGNTAELNAQVKQLGQAIGARITVVKADGTVIADNQADPTVMENHRLRPEIVAAAAQGEGDSLRHSDTVHQAMMYFARRIDQAGAPPHYVRLAVYLDPLDQHLRALYAGLGLAAFLAMLCMGAICYYFAHRQTAPLVHLTRFADGLAHGDLNRRIRKTDTGEIGTLATALNSMADSLGRLIRQAQHDNAELLAILSSMSEGVVATDMQRRVVLVNDAAAGLLGFALPQARGRLLWEVVRNEAVIHGADEVLASGQGKTIQVGPIAGRHLEVTVCVFTLSATPGESDPEPQGLVLVAHDVTQSVRYQELRKEFVANVSHELRTPLTAIKGFSQTLLDGAMQDPVKGPQYLATIEKHADQLANLVSDLLELSSLESHPDLPRHIRVDMDSTARKAVQLLLPAAGKKNQALTIETVSKLPPVAGDPDYLERAVTNLVENAIKYTPPGGKVEVALKTDASHVIVEVRDNGIGIPPEDLPRIFERFYRVDRSRSREMGGTGLGLSIVKHIAQTHRGSVEVTSTPGKGSCFRLKLPVGSG